MLVSTNSQINYPTLNAPQAIRRTFNRAQQNPPTQTTQSTEIKQENNFSFLRAIKNFGKGLISPITSMFSSTKNFLIGTGMIVGGIALTVATGGAVAPILFGFGLAMGGYQTIQGIYKLACAKNAKEAEEAFGDFGAATSVIGLSILGARASLKPIGIEASNMSRLGATAECIKAIPTSLRLSGRAFVDGSWRTNISSIIHPNTKATQALTVKEPPTTDLAITKHINNQLELYTSEEIQSLINSFPPREQATAMLVLDRTSKFSRPGSLNYLFEYLARIERQHPDKYRIYTEGRASLGDQIYYLQRKGNYQGKLPPTTKLRSLEHMDPMIHCSNKSTKLKGILLVADDALIEGLRANPRAIARIQELQKAGYEVKLVYPEGWDEGINLFNHAGISDIRTKVSLFCKRVEHLKAQKGFSTEEAISEVLSSNVKRQLRKLGLDSNLEIVQAQDANALRVPTYEGIADQLSPHQLSARTLYELTRNGKTKHTGTIRKILGESLQVRSPRVMTRLFRKQHGAIKKLATQKQIASEKIFYYIPEFQKSYGLTTMHYRHANNIPHSQIITHLEQIPSSVRDKSMIVVIDDFAGSGQSLGGAKGIYQKIRSRGYNGDIVIAPLSTTNRALRLFSGLSSKDSKLSYIPAEIHQTFRESPFYSQLSKDQQRLIDEYIGQYRGHENTESSIVFWYMSPNNNLPVIEWIARALTLNRNGVKNTTKFTRNCRARNTTTKTISH